MDIPRGTLALVGVALLVAACGSAAPAGSGGSAPTSTDLAATLAPPAASQAATASPAPLPAVAAECREADRKFDASKVDLTGPWAGDDGGIYFLRQMDSVLWWNGMADRAGTPEHLGRAWNNVARGEIDGLSIAVSWADVPRGGILDGGAMKLKIEPDAAGNTRIVKVSEQRGDFGNTTWTPCTIG